MLNFLESYRPLTIKDEVETRLDGEKVHFIANQNSPVGLVTLSRRQVVKGRKEYVFHPVDMARIKAVIDSHMLGQTHTQKFHRKEWSGQQYKHLCRLLQLDERDHDFEFTLTATKRVATAAEAITTEFMERTINNIKYDDGGDLINGRGDLVSESDELDYYFGVIERIRAGEYVYHAYALSQIVKRDPHMLRHLIDYILSYNPKDNRSSDYRPRKGIWNTQPTPSVGQTASQKHSEQNKIQHLLRILKQHKPTLVVVEGSVDESCLVTVRSQVFIDRLGPIVRASNPHFKECLGLAKTEKEAISLFKEAVLIETKYEPLSTDIREVLECEMTTGVPVDLEVYCIQC